MKLEDQVISLDLAKKLKELGAKQASIFIWDRDNELQYNGSDGFFAVRPDISAFTVGELGQLLPSRIKKVLPFWHSGAMKNAEVEFELQLENNQNTEDFCCYYDFADYHCGESESYYIPSKRGETWSCHDTNEANARAKLLVCLYEEGLL